MAQHRHTAVARLDTLHAALTRTPHFAVPTQKITSHTVRFWQTSDYARASRQKRKTVRFTDGMTSIYLKNLKFIFKFSLFECFFTRKILLTKKKLLTLQVKKGALVYKRAGISFELKN